LNRRSSRNLFAFVVSLGIVSSVAVFAQQPGKMSLPPPPDAAHTRPPNPKGADPKPEPAEPAILAAFDKYQVVAMSAAHGNKDLDDFILNLIRNPEFPSKVNIVAVECGNSLYQPTLDQYIAGADIPLSEVRQVWRNTTQSMCGLSSFYEQLFPLLRRINQALPPARKLRVVACDPAIDWSKVKTRADFGHGQYLMRDPTIAAVMEKEVLSKHRKALMLFGIAHLFHQQDAAVGLYERNYPGVTLVIADHVGFGNGSPLAKYNDQFEARLASWPTPSLVLELRRTWLADLLDQTAPQLIFFGPAVSSKLPNGPAPAKGTFSEVPPDADKKFSAKVDAYLYLAPRDLLLNEPVPATILLDKDYMTELQRRAALVGEGPISDDADPKNILEHDANPFFYDPDELKKLDAPPPQLESLPQAAPAHPAAPR
jgi:hypothetical protein